MPKFLESSIWQQVSKNWSETKNSPIIPGLKPWTFRWIKFPKQDFLENYWNQAWENQIEKFCKEIGIFYNPSSWKDIMFLIWDFIYSRKQNTQELQESFKQVPIISIFWAEKIEDISLNIKIWNFSSEIKFWNSWKHTISVGWINEIFHTQDTAISQLLSYILQKQNFSDQLKNIFSAKNSIKPLKTEIESITFQLFPDLVEEISKIYHDKTSNNKLNHVIFWEKIYSLYNWIYSSHSVLKPKDFDWYRIKPYWIDELQGFDLIYQPNVHVLKGNINWECNFILPECKISHQLEVQYLGFVDILSLSEKEKNNLKLKLKDYFLKAKNLE